jgi:hypothetical protein
MDAGLKREIERRAGELTDLEWELELHEALDPSDPVEAYLERGRLGAAADDEVRRLLNTLEFSSRATRRLDYLLGLAHRVIAIYHRRRLLGLQRAELDGK